MTASSLLTMRLVKEAVLNGLEAEIARRVYQAEDKHSKE